MIGYLRNWWRSVIVFSATDRALLYRALAVQLKAGRSPRQAFEALVDAGISNEMAVIANCAAAAAEEGRLTMAGVADTGFLPRAEAGILQLAERNNRLPQVCEQLLSRSNDRLGFIKAVVSPNLYYIAVLGILLFMLLQASDLIHLLPLQDTGFEMIPAYRWSVFLQQWGLFILLLATGYAAAVLYGRTRFIGALRRGLLVFNREYRHLLTVRIAELASLLYRQGATHIQFLDALAEAFGDEFFVRRGVINARNHLVEGASLDQAIADDLVSPATAATLAALVPGGATGLYPGAFDTVRVLEQTQLEKLYFRFNQNFRLSLLLISGCIILILAHGIYSAIIAA